MAPVRDNRVRMLLRPRFVVVLLVLAAALVPAVPAAAKTIPPSPPFRVLIVDHLSPAQLRAMVSHGAAVGLLVPGAGPTTNRRQALAQLVRGAQMNARLGGVPGGPRLIAAALATGTPTGRNTIVVVMPPKGPSAPNDRRYPVVVLGGGFHGLLDSPTTKILGLVSIVDIAPTALGRKRGSLSSTATPDPVASLTSLDRQIHANNRLKLPALIVVACAVLLLAAVRPRAAMTSVLAALLASIALGAAQVTSEPLIVAMLLVGTLGGGLWLAQLCRSDGRLLALIVGVLVVHLVLLAKRPEWVALTPLGPTQNSRFWGIGNQLETLLLAPLIVGAALAGRRYGRVGFGAFAALAIVLVTDNRLGSDGGGAIVLGVAFAFLGARVLRLGVRGFVTLLLLGATAVLAIVSLNLRAAGPDHLRSAFGHGLSGLLSVAENRVPLAYEPALHDWPLVLPLALWFVAALVLGIRLAQRRATRDLVLAVGLAIGTSLLVNDSATYELVGGVAALAALVRFTPGVTPLTLPVLARVPLPAQPLPNEASHGDGVR
jgi:hypothetical protein